jgi:malonate-semialdehyde dehydrogenase (acetylating)/methylmalonate-semialdehyde dehydrogenase
MEKAQDILNYVNGHWTRPSGYQKQAVTNPATSEELGEVFFSSDKDVDLAVQAASKAFVAWRKVPAGDRIQYLFKLKFLLEQNLEDLARTITLECGKTLEESRGEIRRSIENVEVACGIPSLMQGTVSEDIASGIDEFMIRQPVGVAAVIAPFNFPGMIPFWFFPYALACGNAYIVKPSERVPLTMQKVFALMDQSGFPKGVITLLNGSRETVDALLDHPQVNAISFVGSTRVARYVYGRAAANGKRAQCQGGAKNPIVILPDADLEMTTRITADSAFGCAGQRCLAASLAITVGEAKVPFTDAFATAAGQRIVGNGLDAETQMGPVITAESKARIEKIITDNEQQGARLVVDGRSPSISGYEKGYFLRPTVIEDIPPQSEILKTEIFGPVLGILHTDTVEEAIRLVNSGRYGNMACVFTNDGNLARKFRNECQAGNIGINIGVAAPIAYFPFSGWKDSFFGDLHGQSMDAVNFFTQKKVVIERWPKSWSRKF